MSDEIVKAEEKPGNGIQAAEEAAAVEGLLRMELTRLTPAQRALYCWHFAQRLGLDPTTKPFDIISTGGKTFLYANRGAAEQIRKRERISLEIVERGLLQLGEKADATCYVVRVRASTPDGRSDESLGAVNIAGLMGESLANAIMKCETKAKRRATYSIFGLGGVPDESELGGIRAEPAPAVGTQRVIVPPAVEVVEGTTVTTHTVAEVVAIPKKYPPASAPVSFTKKS